MLTLLVVLAMQGDIHGRVVSAANNTPVAMATVSVRDSTRAAPPAQTTTDADGAFRVQACRPDVYRVRIVAIGYAPRELPSI